MKVSELLGMPIISLTDGEKVGVVKDLLIDPQELRATAILLGGVPGQGVLPLESISSVGKDAITIEVADSIHWATEPVSSAAGRETNELKKLRVVDSSGTDLGKVQDILLDLPSGKVVSLHVGGGGVFGIGGHSSDVAAVQVRAIGAALITADVPVAAPVQ